MNDTVSKVSGSSSSSSHQTNENTTPTERPTALEEQRDLARRTGLMRRLARTVGLGSIFPSLRPNAVQRGRRPSMANPDMGAVRPNLPQTSRRDSDNNTENITTPPPDSRRESFEREQTLLNLDELFTDERRHRNSDISSFVPSERSIPLSEIREAAGTKINMLKEREQALESAAKLLAKILGLKNDDNSIQNLTILLNEILRRQDIMLTGTFNQMASPDSEILLAAALVNIQHFAERNPTVTVQDLSRDELVRLLALAMNLALKQTEDVRYDNGWWAQALGITNIRRFNEMEIDFLNRLDWEGATTEEINTMIDDLGLREAINQGNFYTGEPVSIDTPVANGGENVAQVEGTTVQVEAEDPPTGAEPEEVVVNTEVEGTAIDINEAPNAEDNEDQRDEVGTPNIRLRGRPNVPQGNRTQNELLDIVNSEEVERFEKNVEEQPKRRS